MPTPAPNPATPSAANLAPTPDPAPFPGNDDIEAVASLVMRSQDVFATLKDLIRHERSQAEPSSRHLLASMLEATRLMEWDNAPVCEAGRLTRNRHYWIRFDANQLVGDAYDLFIAVEAALGLNQYLPPEVRTGSVGDPAVTQAMLAHLASRYDDPILPFPVAGDIDLAYPADTGTSLGEWQVRVCAAQAAECAQVPFRVVYDLRVNMAEGLAVISLEVPRPPCFAIFATTPQEWVEHARTYALRVSALLARHVLAARRNVREVVVNCHEHLSSDILLSGRYTQALLDRLRPLLTALDASWEIPADPDLRVHTVHNNQLVPAEPFASFADERVSPAWRQAYPELVHTPCSPALAAATGATTIADLGINESASRHAAWDELAAQRWSTTAEAAAALVALRDVTADITVAEACTRTVEALVNGAIEVSNLEAVHGLFVAGTALEQACRRAGALLGDGPSPNADPEAAIPILEEALAPIDTMGIYLDDADAIYRYFGSVAERLSFNCDVDDHARPVRLVPDAYFDALGHLSTAYGMLGHLDEALARADEMIRIAPVSAFAVMRKVRALEAQSRIFEAADLIRGVLRHALTPRDAAICHYRLAYMEWKLGREDLAVACYQRALRWNTDISPQANEELADLLKSNATLQQMGPDQVDALLAREGIPLGCDANDQRRLRAAAITCCDAGVFHIARPFVGILFSFEGDDVLMGVYRSLEA